MALSLPTHHDESAVAAGDVDLSHLDLDDLVGVAHDEKAARLAAVGRARARPELVLALAGAHRHAFWKGKYGTRFTPRSVASREVPIWSLGNAFVFEVFNFS